MRRRRGAGCLSAAGAQASCRRAELGCMASRCQRSGFEMEGWGAGVAQSLRPSTSPSGTEPSGRPALRRGARAPGTTGSCRARPKCRSMQPSFCDNMQSDVGMRGCLLTCSSIRPQRCRQRMSEEHATARVQLSVSAQWAGVFGTSCWRLACTLCLHPSESVHLAEVVCGRAIADCVCVCRGNQHLNGVVAAICARALGHPGTDSASTRLYRTHQCCCCSVH